MARRATPMALARLAAAVCVPALVAAQQCVYYIDDLGVEYDLSQLRNESPFKITAGAYEYRFSFCGVIPGVTCAGNATASMQVQPGSGSACQQAYGQLAGAPLLPQGTPGDGFVLKYENGPLCSNGVTPTSTVFTVNCVPGQSPSIVQSPSTSNPCSVAYTIKSAAGCPSYKSNLVRTLGVGWIVFLSALVAVTVYLGVGIVYKRRVYGASGIEAVPNIDLWRSVAGKATAVVTCGRKRPAAEADMYMQAPDDGPAYTDYPANA